MRSASVVAGGILGTLTRWWIEGVFLPSPPGFPWGTLVINVTGAFAPGAVGVILMERVAHAATYRIQAPIAPGLLTDVGVRDWHTLSPGEAVTVSTGGGSVALDGEREIEVSEQDKISVSLQTDAFLSIDVGNTLKYAAEKQLLVSPADFVPVEGPNLEEADVRRRF